MSHILGQFLSSRGRYFDQLMTDLEKSTGSQGLDADLIGQVVTQANLKIRALGLTPGDTLPEEMYRALINKFINDSQLVHYRLLGDNLDLNFLNFQIARQLNVMVGQPVYGLTNESVIKLLQEVPTTKLLRGLGSISLEEVLTKYHQLEVFELAWLLGSKVWRSKMADAIAQLPDNSFEVKELTYHSISRGLAKFYKSALNGAHFQASNLTGSVLFLNYSLSERRRQMVLGSLIQGLVAAQQLIDFSNQLQIMAQSKYFNDHLKSMLAGDASRVWQLCGVPVPWRSIYRVLANPESKLSQNLKSEIGDCKFGRIDIVNTLSDHFQNLNYWPDGQGVAFKIQNDIVSMNLVDVAVNAHTPDEIWLGQTANFESVLWDELIARYLEHDYLVRQIKIQLQTNQKERK